MTYDWDTDTLFVVGDGGTSVVQVSKTGQLIDSMTLAPGSSPQGTDFYDPEGLTYVGGGKFVMSEERDRQAVLFTYVPGTTLHRTDAQTVKLGTFVDNIGNRRHLLRPATTTQTRGFIVVKETQPEGIFQTNIDFAAGTATNGSPNREPDQPVRPGAGEPVGLRRRLRFVESAVAERRRFEPPAGAEPGSGQDRQHQPLRRHLPIR